PSAVAVKVGIVCDTSLAPTVIGNAAEPGDPTVFSPGPVFPAATTVTTLESMALFTATDVGESGSLTFIPKDRLITSIPSFTALSIPANTQSVCPLPYGPSTR